MQGDTLKVSLSMPSKPYGDALEGGWAAAGTLWMVRFGMRSYVRRRLSLNYPSAMSVGMSSAKSRPLASGLRWAYCA